MPPVPLHVAVPALLIVLALTVLVLLPLIVMVPLEPTAVAPVPDKVPPVQLKVPAVSVAEPPCVPLETFKVVVEPLLSKLAMPPLIVVLPVTL